MTPTEKKYAQRIGKLYWMEGTSWTYPPDGSMPVSTEHKTIFMVASLFRKYDDAGKYLYYCLPLEPEKCGRNLNSAGMFKIVCGRFNEHLFPEVKPGEIK